MRWMSGIGIVASIWLIGPTPTVAQNPQSAALKEIRDTAADICVTVEQKGKKNNAQLTGEVEAKVSGVAAKLADLGVKGSGEIGTQEYQGVSQEALVTALSDIRMCRQHVFDKLVDRLLPPQGSIATPTELEKPSESSQNAPQKSLSNVLYETGIRGFENWSLTRDWKRLDEMLINDGTGRGIIPTFSPYRPKSRDYAVEAEIRVSETNRGWSDFGFIIRADGKEGYAAGIFGAWPGYGTPNVATLDKRIIVRGHNQNFAFGNDWHTYRVEVRGNAISLLIDNGIRASVTDNRFLSPGRVGLWSEIAQLEIRSFKITSLEPTP